ncbi:carbonic anhydrase [Thermomonospora amylolytica]|uniref:carbonic anhydrase n=1 Tax=Thermomonospora amylolytica TaxID=1411117 RepID=UPI000E6D4698|nr:carbonic anhydrase [Thermomonospora amylolytica]
MDDAPRIPRRRVLRGAVGAAGLAALGPLVAGCSTTPLTRAVPQAAERHLTPAEAWERLAVGNMHWVAGRLDHPDQTPERRRAVAAAQHPFATVLTCIDSRVTPETVFDQGVGDLFVVRTGAQTVDGLVTGSVEYGPLQDGIPLIVVLGHQSCGAVKAAVAAIESGRRPPGHLADVVEALRPAVEEARAQGGDTVDRAVHAQIRRTVAELRRDPALAPRIDRRGLGLVGAYYELASGRVSLLSTVGF